MVEVVLNKIRIDEKSEGQVIVLKEKNGDRYLPIIIGISEVVAIKRNLSDIQPQRPMTHDLLANIIYALGARLERVIINKIEANTFYAQLVLRVKDGEPHKKVVIDARPSDSIALAARVEAPIFVEDRVFEVLKKYEGQVF
jgi:bifunctional DNase/RNase